MCADAPSGAMCADAPSGAMCADAPYGAIADAAILTEGDRIAWIGPAAEAPAADAVHDAGGAWATPGLVDCHTHLVFGGNRAREFEMRLEGATYEELARAGGGILSTVRATRATDEAGLVAAALPRLDALLRDGVTTVEIKSGYGLETETELRMLRAARALAGRRRVTVQTSFLGAHAVPAGEDRDAYMDRVIAEMLPRAAPLSDAVDGFCDTIGFTAAQTRRLFEAARALGLPVKLHAEQLSNQGGAALLAEFGGLSADHLEHLDQAGVEALAAAGSVAVLLPGATYVLRETHRPPVDALRAAGVPIAVATDANPGSAPIFSPRLAMHLACTLFGLTPEEALAGFTRNGARALGLHDRGTLAPGMRADIALWRVGHPAELVYELGVDRLAARIVGGEPA
jgi:imidazolonepropionase